MDITVDQIGAEYSVDLSTDSEFQGPKKNDNFKVQSIFIPAPALTLVKSATPATYDAVGDVISYSYDVENTGNVAFAGPVTVTDDKATVTCPSGGLAVGASMTCTASYTITQADLDGGSVKNTAQAHANGTDSNQDDETVTAVANPDLSLVKTAAPTSYSEVGDVIEYSYDVENTGNVTLAGPVTVVDDKATVTCPTGDLAPGASITCEATYTITQADLDAGSVTNTAMASADGTDSNEDSETVNAVENLGLSLVKTATPATYDSVGDVISYSYEVKNTSNVTLAGPVTVTDDKATVTCPAGGLAPGATKTCTASYTITQADLNTGSVKNTAQAHANTVNSNYDDETVTADQNPALSLVKTATPDTYDTVGDVISYSYVVKNTGNVTLAGPVTVADDKATVTCPAGGLAPGASKTCTASYTITQADLDSGSVTNTAKASANGTDSNEDSETVNADQNPALSLVKKATPTGYGEVGDVISYSYEVKNTGNVTLEGPVTVDDDKATVTCPAGDLAPGASITCTASYTITQADLDAGSVTNTATGHADGIASNEDSETVNVIPNQELSLVKAATPATYDEVGDVISYSYEVTNEGNQTLAGPVTVDDDKASVTCPAVPAGGLAPQASITCTASYTITQADLDAGSVKNTAQAHANDVNSNFDDETVTAVDSPAIAVVKTSATAHLLGAGEVVEYTFTVTNIGNVTLTDITVDDPKCAAAPELQSGDTNGDSKLQRTETWVYTCSHTVTQAELDAAPLSNTVTVDSNETDSVQDSLDIPYDPVTLTGECNTDTGKIDWTLRNPDPFAFSFNWSLNDGEETGSGNIIAGTEADPTTVVFSTDKAGDMAVTTSTGIDVAHGTAAACVVPLTIAAVCAANPEVNNGWNITNPNETDMPFELSNVSRSWDVAGQDPIPAGQTVYAESPITAGNTIQLYSNGVLQASATALVGCFTPPNPPQPPPNPPVNPPTGGGPVVLIPVTGVDLGAFGRGLPGSLASTGLGFLGLGLVLNGIARRREE